MLPDLLSLNLPYDLSCASFSFCSRTSARRLRKSERFTSPIVCDLSRSSAEAVWFAKDRGEDVPGGVSDGGAMIGTRSKGGSIKYYDGLQANGVKNSNTVKDFLGFPFTRGTVWVSMMPSLCERKPPPASNPLLKGSPAPF